MGRVRVVAEADAGWTAYATFDTRSLGEFKHKEVRYLNIREEGQLDEAQIASWMK